MNKNEQIEYFKIQKLKDEANYQANINPLKQG